MALRGGWRRDESRLYGVGFHPFALLHIGDMRLVFNRLHCYTSGTCVGFHPFCLAGGEVMESLLYIQMRLPFWGQPHHAIIEDPDYFVREPVQVSTAVLPL
jgi:hypothetical protein